VRGFCIIQQCALHLGRILLVLVVEGAFIFRPAHRSAGPMADLGIFVYLRIPVVWRFRLTFMMLLSLSGVTLIRVSFGYEGVGVYSF